MICVLFFSRDKFVKEVMDNISSTERKPAVPVNSMGSYSNSNITVSNMAACYPRDDTLPLARNHSINNVTFPGSQSYTESRINPEEASCKI